MFRPVKVRQYIAVMKAKGHSAESVLAGSGVSLAKLSAPDFLMEIDQSRVIVSNMVALTSDQGIGLEIGARTTLTELGMVGYVMMSSQSLRDTIRHWINYSDTLIGMPMQVRLEEHAPDDWALVFTESVPLGFIYNFCVEEQLVMSYKLGCDLVSPKPIPRRLELSFPAPSHHLRYQEYFDCPIVFNSRHTRIRFSAPRLDQPLRGNDREINQLCAHQCELLVRQIGQRCSLASTIKNMLMRAQETIPTIETVAGQLHMSGRSLRRHLQDEGVSYQQLVNEVRANKAKEYLRSSVSPKEVSYRLGFTESNSFHRAFKMWTGQTVREYLDSQRHGCSINSGRNGAHAPHAC